MRKLLRKTLLREYFFEQLSSLYEQVSVQQLACVKQQFLTKRVQLSSIRLDERVEAALAKAARVYQPEKQQLGERQSRGVVNVEVFGALLGAEEGVAAVLQREDCEDREGRGTGGKCSEGFYESNWLQAKKPLFHAF